MAALLEYVKVENEEDEIDDEEGEVNIAIIASNPRPHRKKCDGIQVGGRRRIDRRGRNRSRNRDECMRG